MSRSGIGCWAIAAAVLFGGANVGDAGIVAIDFARDVLPIVERSCIECHQAPSVDGQGRTRKPKGGLRLDAPSWMIAGGNEGGAIVPFDPEASTFYERITLDADDPDRMPKEGDPLTHREVELVKRWIEAGAGFGAWKGSDDEVAAPVAVKKELAIPAALHDLREIAGEVPRADATKLAAAVGEVGVVREVFPGEGPLRVHYISHEDDVSDREVARLLGIKDQVVRLRLRRTRVTDAGLADVAKLRRVMWLDLAETEVTDVGIARLGALAELRSLNLFHTAATDRALDALAKLPRLEVVYLDETRVTDAGVAKLRVARPSLRIVDRFDVPTEYVEVSDEESDG